MMFVFFLVALVCLTPPFTPIGVGGLLAWLICAVTFTGGDEIATEIDTSGKGCGFVWMVLVFILVLLGGGAAFAVLATMANAGR